ncbi:MAG TPA: ABC transporter ATP-binding protein [Desulfobacterales bacterium]
MSLLIAENITKIYGSGPAAVKVIDGMHFSIESGEFVAVMGESGSGKSTLLSVLGAMNAPSSGRMYVDDIDIYGLNPERRADFRREFLGFVFQSFHLIPYLTVIENVLLPLSIVRSGRSAKKAKAEAALESVGLTDKGHRLPHQISGGEKERVAVARAIVNSPPILLADEPTGSLDSKTSREIMQLLQNLNHEGMTVIMVTHSHECARYATRVLQIADGILVEAAMPRNHWIEALN